MLYLTGKSHVTCVNCSFIHVQRGSTTQLHAYYLGHDPGAQADLPHQGRGLCAGVCARYPRYTIHHPTSLPPSLVPSPLPYPRVGARRHWPVRVLVSPRLQAVSSPSLWGGDQRRFLRGSCCTRLRPTCYAGLPTTICPACSLLGWQKHGRTLIK